jgi:predicted MFS family arabinose efflux permease
MVLPEGNRGDRARVTTRKNKAVYFTIEGLNSFSTTLYISYLYFLTRDHFGFGNKRNLALAAALGLVYTVAAWQAGKFAQRRGYFTALKTGFTVMAVSLGAGLIFSGMAGQLLAATATTIGICCTWPTLEALVSEGETEAGLPRVVGIYNVIWAVTNAFAFFIGGTLIKLFGFQVILALPLLITIGLLAVTFRLERRAGTPAKGSPAPAGAAPPVDPDRPTPQVAHSFLRMAWLANPFAYIAINTLIAVIPGIAAKFQLSPMLAGFVCSLWGFVRLGAFVVLWQWTGWHYRFRWLAGAFALLIVSFAGIVMSPGLIMLVAAQVFFGGAIGLIYYSSLFYSMDAGDAKGEHGGIHEAAIGLGNCLGPAVGAAALEFLPGTPNSGAVAVSILLCGGFAGLFGIWKRGK